ncbi:MAG: Crp/Fnr family transcriptional regulator [[Pasteurella] mairii]|uniref:Cyclic nucleotide-binding domain-containing protein n=1 Tax=[Pasteurella] mairii TaxID=757 RepID=A0A379B2E4_9PAST|nr:Crp/Fnr family transcriptional regulator [[Pasteurella] mairii]SUB32671.1 cyclic nucleotide-binding domain-containing protein [[Pasteurella] mairii]
MSIIYPTDLKHCQLTYLNSFSKGATIYTQGEEAKEFYYIINGLIGLYHSLDNGKESLVRLYQKGEYFGYRTLFDRNIYHCNAKVLVNAALIRIKPTNLNTFFIENPKMNKFLIQALANELREAEQRLTKISYLRTLDRVIDSIYFLTDNFPYYNWTHREIAEYAGCETETAIRITKELKRNGLLKNLHKDKTE